MDRTLNPLDSHRYGLSLALVICGKAKFCLWVVRWFFPEFSSFRPPLMDDRLNMGEIFLKGQKKKEKKMKNQIIYPSEN